MNRCVVIQRVTATTMRTAATTAAIAGTCHSDSIRLLRSRSRSIGRSLVPGERFVRCCQSNHPEARNRVTQARGHQPIAIAMQTPTATPVARSIARSCRRRLSPRGERVDCGARCCAGTTRLLVLQRRLRLIDVTTALGQSARKSINGGGLRNGLELRPVRRSASLLRPSRTRPSSIGSCRWSPIHDGYWRGARHRQS